MLAFKRCIPRLHALLLRDAPALLRLETTNHIFIPIVARRHLSNNNKSDTESVQDYLTSLGIRSELHQPVLSTIQPLLGPIKQTADDANADITVSDIENAMSAEDLLALSQSIDTTAQKSKQQQTTSQKSARRRPTKQVVFSIPPRDGEDSTPNKETTLTWRYGQSILELAQQQQQQGDEEDFLKGLDNMEGPCGGKCCCSTCHVYLDSTTLGAIPPPSEEELDMLDLAFEPKETSRLGCQVRLSDSLLQSLDPDHAITITIPSGVNNEWE